MLLRLELLITAYTSSPGLHFPCLASGERANRRTAFGILEPIAGTLKYESH